MAAGLGVESTPAGALKISKEASWLEFNLESDQANSAEGGMLKGNLLLKNNNLYLPVEITGKYFGFTINFIKKVSTSEVFNEFPIKRASYSAVQKEKNDYVAVTSNAGAPVQTASEKKPEKAKKIVYLTFNDGPTGETPKILDILKKKQAKATIFMLEPQMKQYKDQVKRLVEEGHYPALHSVSHDKNKLYGGSPKNMAAEMERTRQTLLKITGVDS